MKRRAATVIVIAGSSILAACGSSGSDDAQPVVDVRADDCIVHLHGKGGSGSEATVDGDVAHLRPSGNRSGWGARQWIYFPDDAFAEAVSIVSDTADAAGCTRVVVNGFSNGAAFAGKLLCSGTTLDDRLVGVVIDDPVPDLGVADCSADPGVEAVVYWTGELGDTAPPGTDCGDIDWTCDGGTVTSIDEYAAAIGVEVTPSPFTDHQPYLDAPEPGVWLATQR